MSKKIVLTVEQATAVDSFKKKERDTWEYLVKRKTEKSFHLEYKPFNEMTLDDIVQAVFVGYEIEPKFEIGDWAKGYSKLNDKKFIFKIIRLTEDRAYGVNGSHNNFIWLPSLEHATKEEIVWAELGREVLEFKDGDHVVFKDDSSTIVDLSYSGVVDFIKEKHEKGRVKGFYPANSFIKLP